MKIQVLDGPALVAGAKDWFGSLGQWPTLTPDQMAKALVRAKHITKAEVTDTPYFGIQAVLALLIAANDNEWPPMTPDAFAANLPHMEDQIMLFAKTIIRVEATSPILNTLNERSTT